MRTTRKTSCFERNALVSADVLAANLNLFPEKAGVYAIAGKAAIPILDLEGYYGLARYCHGFIGMEPIIYIGSARCSSVRKRAADHLFGDARKSTFRQSLGIALAESLKLRPVSALGQSGFHFGDGEAALTAWIRQNLLLTFELAADPIQRERVLVKANNPPFNIKEREWDPFARQMSLRRQAASRNQTPATFPSDACVELEIG